MSDKYFTTNKIENSLGLQPLDFSNKNNMKLNNGARTASSITDPVIDYKNTTAGSDNYTGNQLGEFFVDSIRSEEKDSNPNTKLNFTLGKATTSEDFKYLRLDTDEESKVSTINYRADEAADTAARKDAITAIYNTGSINAIKYRDSNGE